MLPFHDIWEPVLKALSEKFSDTIMDLWFNHLTMAALSDTTVVLVSDSDMKADIINKRYRETLAGCFEGTMGFPVDVVTISSENKVIDLEQLQNDVRMGIPVEPFSIRREHVEKTVSGEPSKPMTTEEIYLRNPEYTIDTAPISDEERQKPHIREVESNDKEPAVFVASDTLSEKMPDPKRLQMQNEVFFNSEYTFENFIVGSSNKFAHAACVAVANNPASAYNPLFIHGPSGLGKTHLLYAITNRIREKAPNANIVYVKAEAFTVQLIEAISTETTAEFRDKYRQADVLLIDDVQFIAGRVSTQEEFFNTFNELYEARKQIILTSDRPPKEINTLEDRLKTRFEWGLIVDIQPPDLELRIAILRKKAQVMEIDIPIEVLNYLAENLKNNIRQIEGAIKRLGAYASLTSQPITLEMAKNNIADVVRGPEPVKVTQDKIFASVAKKYGVTPEDIRGTRRTREIAMARHVSIYIMRTVTEMSLPSIGKVFNRDHTTVLASVEKIQGMIREDSSVEAEIADLIKDIKEQ